MADERLPDFDFGSDKDFKEILTNPFLDIAARFWDKPRYEAFQVCYRSMRFVDDLVDDRKAAGTPISEKEVARYREMIVSWLDGIRTRTALNAFQTELVATFDRYAIPLWPWERLCRAMIYDLKHDGFKSFRVFLRYAEGAAIAPASVFTHLCGVGDGSEGCYLSPTYDVREAARSLALFSYLVHILRDFQKDQLRGLNYFAEDILTTRSLTPADLRRVAEGGKISDGLRDLIGQYRGIADYYRRKARHTLDDLADALKPRYRLSLEVIYGLYCLVFERIDPRGGRFTEDELNPSPLEIRNRIEQIASDFKADNNL